MNRFLSHIFVIGCLMLIALPVFSADYNIPKAFDPRVAKTVAAAVAAAARASGVARLGAPCAP